MTNPMDTIPNDRPPFREVEPEPQETDNGPKPGDAPVDQRHVEIDDRTGGGPRRRAGARAVDILRRAQSHVGIVEAPPGSNQQVFGREYGWNGVPWCNIFVSEVGRQVTGGYELLGRYAWTPACAQWWCDAGRFGRTPRPGAVVFFDWSGSRQLAAIDHVGLVIEARPDGRVRTIEGNAAIHGKPEGVWVHDRASANIVGYGYPAYAGADHEFGDEVPASTYRTYQRVPAGSRTLTLLDAGDDVSVLQRGIGAPADGYFGPLTRNRLVAYQRRHGLIPDATAGPRVWDLILGRQTIAHVPAFPGTTRRGSRGQAVTAVQQRLRDRGWNIASDGIFGPATDRAVRAFQREKRLSVDGIVGPRTWRALWLAPVNAA